MPMSTGCQQSLREAVLSQHTAIRHAFRETAACSRRVLRGECAAELPRRVQHLVRLLLAHLDFEERALLPLLCAVDTHGRRQAARLVAEHRRQRADLATVRADLPGAAADPTALATVVHALIEDMLADMRAEEASLLDLDPVLERAAG
jgi:hypothetical protein